MNRELAMAVHAGLLSACFFLTQFCGGAEAGRSGTAELMRARVFDEPLVPIGGEPSSEENSALASALRNYSRRQSPDDFSSLDGFIKAHPRSAWNGSLLTSLGTEFYNTAHFSKALEAWSGAWDLLKDANDAKAKALADRAVGELAYMQARLGRMEELQALLKSVENRTFIGSATELISGARDGLWNMQHRPEISFRCGPLALHRIKAMTGPSLAADIEIHKSASTQRGTSLPEVAELSKKIGLNYQMAFREKGAPFIVPSIVHWKVGHYAAMTKREGGRFLLQDPTFGNDVWGTTNALESETSGYFLVPPGALPKGWRVVDAAEGGKVWGKGTTSENDRRLTLTDLVYEKDRCRNDNVNLDDLIGDELKKQADDKQREVDDIIRRILDSQHENAGSGIGGIGRMAVSGVHLMLVNLNIKDSPVGYTPPVGPAVEFTVRYNHREAFQPVTFTYANFGPKWTCDWISYINDTPQSPSADVNYYARGGGVKTFTGFDTNTQLFAPQQYGQARLKRIAPDAYEMTTRNGSTLIFSRSDGASGTSRKIFLTQILDAASNTVTLNYDAALRLTNIVDAIGQATTLSYSNATDSYKVTRVTDPFGRFAQFDYDSQGRLTNITDVIGIQSRFVYEGAGDFINTLITPYGTTSFARGGGGTTRWLETTYPDGSRDRVEFNQSSTLGVPFSDPPNLVPRDVSTFNQWLYARNTYYWSRTACAQAYGDYSKAKIYHWLHTLDLSTTAGILESVKEPFEGRVWFDYAGQSAPLYVGATDRPRHAGRVLDDGQTQLYTYDYNEFGHLTNSVDPLGRTFTYLYATNGIDLLEARMTRAGKNELLYRATYNASHLPLTTVDAAGQTNTFAYNARGQVITATNPKNETTTYSYDTNGYLIAVDGPLPGTNDVVTATYDSFGRLRTKTDTDGYTLTFDYDALDRLTRITFPDGTFDQTTYDRLDRSVMQDRAGRQTVLEHNSMRDVVKRTDALGRVTQFQWCRCGSIRSITDPLGRTTQWETDVQGRLAAKIYSDGSRITYDYERTTSRLRQITDEKLQTRRLTWNLDDSLASISTANAGVPTAPVTFTYDADYPRLISITDGTGVTSQQFVPVTVPPTLGAGLLASVDGPLPNDTVTYEYDELGRSVAKTLNGVTQRYSFDAAGRVVAETNALGAFTYVYDGTSGRVSAETNSAGLVTMRAFDSNLHDHVLQRITHQFGANGISEFLYGHDVAANRITSWSQQLGAVPPQLFTFGYDAEDQLLSGTITNAGVLVGSFAYTYDTAANRLSERTPSLTNNAAYNALNQITSSSGGAIVNRTNEWDARDRLVAVTVGNQRTEFTYDGISRLVAIRQLVNGMETSRRQFVWCDASIAEERDGNGVLTKRFFPQGVKIESGPSAGNYFYTRDHLGSVRELVDSGGTVHARYSYDPFGRRTLVAGDVAADFGFAGMFWSSEAQLSIARYRAYDPELGRWLSRDPLRNAEIREGVNLYWYAANNPVNVTDPSGLCCESEELSLWQLEAACDNLLNVVMAQCHSYLGPASPGCIEAQVNARNTCINQVLNARNLLDACERRPCKEGCDSSLPPLPPRPPRLPGGVYGLPDLDLISPPFGSGPQGSGGSTK